MKSYAQHQEDMFIINLINRLQLKVPSTFIDIGACDGIHLSNTRMFAELGWNGLFVEPAKEYYKQLEKNYKHRKDIGTVNAAISIGDGTADFFVSKNPDNSGLIGSDEAEKYTVDTLTYNSLLKAWGVEEIGILSIDTEGFDTMILKQALKHKVKPVFIIVESNDFESRKLHLEMCNKDYHLLNVLSVNTVWIKRDFYEKYCSSTEL